MRIVIFCWTVLLFAAAPAAGQGRSDVEANRLSPIAYYVWGDETDTKVAVQVWGTVRNPGLYDVVEGTRLSTVVTLAGPVLAARETRSDRTLVIRLVRMQGAAPEVVLEQTMANELPALADDVVLRAGDLVTVDTVTRRGFSWRDGVSLLSAATSLAVLFVNLL